MVYDDSEATEIFLRICALPAARARDTWVDVDPDEVDEPDDPGSSGSPSSPGDPDATVAMRALLRRWLADVRLREAVDLASPSLGGSLDKLVDDLPLSQKQVRRCLLAVCKYLLRMCTRPTPFGTFAGVAIGEIGVPPQDSVARVGTDHRRGVRPDRGWLTEYLLRHEKDAGIVAGLRVTPNNLCLTRGSRLVNPHYEEVHEASAGSSGKNAKSARKGMKAAREASIRRTAAVETILRVAHAEQPTVQQLVDLLSAEFPGHPTEKIRDTIGILLEKGFLVSDLHPHVTTPDPLRHVVEKLSGAHSPHEDGALGALSDAVEDYVKAPRQQRLAALRAVTRSASDLLESVQPLQVDLRYDADVRLPAIVREEAVKAGRALRLANARYQEPPHLSTYRDAFRERYGEYRLVPIKRLLDAESGIGAPDGYPHSHPMVHARVQGTDGVDPADLAVPDRHEERRIRRLSEWAQEAMLNGTRELRLDHQMLMSLEHQDATGSGPRELCFQLLASSLEEIGAGNFSLALSSFVGAALVPASFGRFMYLFDDEAERMSALARRHATSGDDRIAAQLSFMPTEPRLANVAAQRQVLPYTIPVGTFHRPADPAQLDLDDLAVFASEHALHLFSVTKDTEVRPCTYSMLNLGRGTNSVARLLRELEIEGPAAPLTWNWGTLESLPYLPRVCHGRSILSPARWRLPHELSDRSLSSHMWDKELRLWRDKFGVPDLVYLTHLDNRVEVNLESALHRGIVRAELRRERDTVLHESLGTAEEDTGWLSGHLAEIIMPFEDAFPPRPPVRTRPRPDRRMRELRHRPGGDWLSIHLYSMESRQDVLLTGAISDLLTSVGADVEQWFFLRYRDPHAHLRIRLKMRPAGSRGQVMERVCGQLGDLCDAGFANRFQLVDYVPELSRYGSGSLIEAAEKVFHADSVATVEMLRRDRTAEAARAASTAHAANAVNGANGANAALPRMVVAAAEVIELTRGLCGERWTEWLLANYPRKKQEPEFRGNRTAIQRLINHEDTTFEALWHPLAAPLRAYAEVLGNGPEADGPRSVDIAFRSILHMHHNRAHGIDREAENSSYAMARSMAQSVVDKYTHDNDTHGKERCAR